MPKLLVAVATAALTFHGIAGDANAQQAAKAMIRPAMDSDLTLIRLQLDKRLPASAAVLFRDVNIRVTLGSKRDDLWNVCGYLNAKDSSGEYIGYRGFYLAGIHDRVAQRLVLTTEAQIHNPDSASSFSVPIEFCKQYGMPLDQ